MQAGVDLINELGEGRELGEEMVWLSGQGYFRATKSVNYCPFSIKFIKSPQYTGGDFMFLYRFVRRRRWPQILGSRDNFLTTLWISFIFGTIVGPDL